ncbi:MAG TPA: flagellar motor switch protein FliG [Desulfotomaculum sp.]|nr:MAG: Flagellar motor switch protein FliG [Desulfotomaculum sp. 46_80]HAG11546.1 flagellar motor switch protein FliG [Desulfotomaculum sp.]HBY03750.1 flagellar motor switch protein FliG [Desulfotomaculum sp.]
MEKSLEDAEPGLVLSGKAAPRNIEEARPDKSAARRLTPLQKAAIVLISMGSDLSSQILKYDFYQEDIERITEAITKLGKIPKSVRESVLEEFKELKQAKSFIITGGTKYAQELLEKTVGHQRAQEIIKKLTWESKTIPFASLRKTDPLYLFNFIRDEHPQTIAMILSYLEPEKAAQILSSLPKEMQSDIARRIAVMDRSNPEVVREVEKVLETRLASVVKQGQTVIGGIPSIVEILNMSDRNTEKTILEELETKAPELADAIRKKLFVFEDIVKLDDISIQRVLREVDGKDLALALRGSSDEVRNCIYNNQSKRAGEMLKEELDFMGPVRLKQVEEAQAKIVKIIRVLEESGEIIISRGGEDVIII